MIQRIQSVYLLLAALLVLAVPVAGGFVTPDSWVWYTPVKAAVSILVSVGCLVAIFLYKDRQRQKRLVTVDLFLALALAGILLAAWLAAAAGSSDLWPSGLPLAAAVFLFLARKSVSKDIELVRSMDRLR
jgi:peptidoglycan/LPS O-acetylase OafA/YrhL